jgi:hypothetical protein
MLLNEVGDEAIRVTDGQDCVLPKVMVHLAYIVKWEPNQSARQREVGNALEGNCKFIYELLPHAHINIKYETQM